MHQSWEEVPGSDTAKRASHMLSRSILFAVDAWLKSFAIPTVRKELCASQAAPPGTLCACSALKKLLSSLGHCCLLGCVSSALAMSCTAPRDFLHAALWLTIPCGPHQAWLFPGLCRLCTATHCQAWHRKTSCMCTRANSSEACMPRRDSGKSMSKTSSIAILHAFPVTARHFTRDMEPSDDVLFAAHESTRSFLYVSTMCLCIHNMYMYSLYVYVFHSSSWQGRSLLR